MMTNGTVRNVTTTGGPFRTALEQWRAAREAGTTPPSGGPFRAFLDAWRTTGTPGPKGPFRQMIDEFLAPVAPGFRVSEGLPVPPGAEDVPIPGVTTTQFLQVVGFPLPVVPPAEGFPLPVVPPATPFRLIGAQR